MGNKTDTAFNYSCHHKWQTLSASASIIWEILIVCGKETNIPLTSPICHKALLYVIILITSGLILWSTSWHALDWMAAIKMGLRWVLKVFSLGQSKVLQMFYKCFKANNSIFTTGMVLMEQPVGLCVWLKDTMVIICLWVFGQSHCL